MVRDENGVGGDTPWTGLGVLGGERPCSDSDVNSLHFWLSVREREKRESQRALEEEEKKKGRLFGLNLIFARPFAGLMSAHFKKFWG